MERVYPETTFISYLVAEPSRDLLVAANKQVTYEWWEKRRHEFSLCVSQVVIDESSQGDPTEVQKRLDVIRLLLKIDATPDVDVLVNAILSERILPASAVRDAAHIAVSAVHAVDYLLTWNCKHMANAQIARRIDKVCKDNGYRMPTICTPYGLLGE